MSVTGWDAEVPHPPVPSQGTRTVWLKGHLIKESEQNVEITEMAAMKGQQKRKQRNRSITIETFS